MRIAILSDIHGNIFALQAVLKEISKKKVDKFFFLGDLTGYYYHPKDVYNLLLENQAFMILGNHEQILFDCIDGIINPEDIRQRYGSGHRIALEQFSTSEIESLRELTESHTEILNGTKLSFHHGAPFDKNFYLYSDTDKEILTKCDSDALFTFVGHSHYPFVSKLSKTTLVNVGSVGQSRQMGGYASWCLLNLNNNVLEMHSTPYDVTPLLSLVSKYDPEIIYLNNILKRR